MSYRINRGKGSWKLRRGMLVFGLVLVGLGVGGAVVVRAATSDTSGETLYVTGGPLEVTNMADGHLNVTLPSNQATGTLPSADFSDYTGSGVGWKAVVQATAFVGARGENITSGFYLDSSAAAPVTGVAGTNTGVPNGAVPVFVDDSSSDILGATPVAFLEAAPNTGMGSYDATEAAVLDFDVPLFAQVYTSNIIYTISTGP